VRIPTLTTERLLLRPFVEDDVAPYFALLQDPDVTRYVGDRRVPTLQETSRSVAALIGHWELRGYGQWAIVERDGEELVGRTGIINPVDWPGPEVGYLLGKRWWSMGYATEAAAAAMAWGFEAIGFERLISLIDPANTASVAVAQRLGERFAGETELWEHRVLVYGIDRVDWEARQSGRSSA
jgi:RimJ/RimL family protein N-acetyltransferase